MTDFTLIKKIAEIYLCVDIKTIDQIYFQTGGPHRSRCWIQLKYEYGMGQL